MTAAIALRPATSQELPALSALCLRSKAYWGYDEAFMAACVETLTLTEADLTVSPLIVAQVGDQMAGMAQLAYVGEELEIDALFVDPPFIGTGCGRVLFDWCVDTAKSMGAPYLRIEADPGAASFYERMGAVRIGEAPSAAIKDRMLPLLRLDLASS